MKPGLYTNDKGTVVVFASYVTTTGRQPEFVEFHHLKPQILSVYWGLDVDDFLRRWPHRIDGVELLEGDGPAEQVKRGLYTDGKKIAWVCEVENLKGPSKHVEYSVVPDDDSIHAITDQDFLRLFPYRVTEIEVRDE